MMPARSLRMHRALCTIPLCSVCALDRPSSCASCRRIFEMSLVLQAEARHIALLEGPGAAESWFDDKLSDQHETH